MQSFLLSYGDEESVFQMQGTLHITQAQRGTGGDGGCLLCNGSDGEENVAERERARVALCGTSHTYCSTVRIASRHSLTRPITPDPKDLPTTAL